MRHDFWKDGIIFLIVIFAMFSGAFMMGSSGSVIWLLIALTAVFLIIFNIKGYIRRAHPMNFDYSIYDLSVIGRRINGNDKKRNYKVFFAELIRLNQKKAIEITAAKNGLMIKRNSGNYILTEHQRAIYESLENGADIAYEKWKYSVNSDFGVNEPLILNTSRLNTIKQSLKFSLFSLIYGVFVAIFIIPVSLIFIGGLLGLYHLSKSKQVKLGVFDIKLLSGDDYFHFTKLVFFYSLAAFILILPFVIYLTFAITEIVFSIYMLLSALFVYITLLIISNDRLADSDESFFGSFALALKEYSELEESENINYFLMYGEHAAWTLALDVNSKHIEEEILKTSIKIK